MYLLRSKQLRPSLFKTKPVNDDEDDDDEDDDDGGVAGE